MRDSADPAAAVITLGAGSGKGHGLTFGHFAADRWQRAGSRLPEMFVGGEGLERGARAVLAAPPAASG